MVLCASTPMVVGGAILGMQRGGGVTLNDLVGPVIRAPILEELVFRGLLIALPFALLGTRRVFWHCAIASALAFGLTHVPWTLDGIASGWATILVTTIGGLWFAWLMRAWQSLLVPMMLHATMNLGWAFASASGGAAGGGVIDNLLRVATITIATIWTIRAMRRVPRGGHE